MAGQKRIKKRNKYNKFINSKHIYLREIRLSDANKDYCRWMNDIEINQYLETRFEKWSVKKLKRYVKKIKKDSNSLFFAIMSKNKNRHIGNIKIGSINRIHKVADVGIIIGEKSFWGKGLATEAIGLTVDFAFKKLNLRKIISAVYANNPGSIKAFKKNGFSIEGRTKKRYFYRGDYVDSILLGITRN